MSTFSIRPLKEKDADKMLEWMRDPDITHYLQIGGPDVKLEQIISFIRSAGNEDINAHRAIVNEKDEYLGTVSLKHIDHEKCEAEYAISMHPAALGSGAAAAGTELILRYAFGELGLRRVYLNVLEENRRAVRFYTKFGFHYTHMSKLLFKGEEKPLLWYEACK